MTFTDVAVEYTEKLNGNGTKISVAVSDSIFDFLRVSIKSRIIRLKRRTKVLWSMER